MLFKQWYVNNGGTLNFGLVIIMIQLKNTLCV